VSEVGVGTCSDEDCQDLGEWELFCSDGGPIDLGGDTGGLIIFGP